MSTFLNNAAPYDMEIEAVQGDMQSQFLVFQENTINLYYGQACGTYTAKLTPDLPFIELNSSGLEGPNGEPYPDTLIISSADLSQIGVYELTLTIEAGSITPISY